MDSRDSSPAASVAGASKDASPADDDGVLSVAAALAKEAGLSFHSGKFSECIDVLRQLLQKKEDDPKILHNVAITEFFQGGCSDPRKLLELLNSVKKRSDELARPSGENVEAAGILGSKAALGSQGTNNMEHQFSATNSSIMVYDNEFDTSLTMLNSAIVWFHLQEYSKAYSILESLYQKIEPIDEGTALHICLLFLDVALASLDPWKSLDIINYLEKSYCVNNLINQGDNGNSAQHQSSNLVAKSSSFASNSTATDAFIPDSVASADASENPLSRTLSEETLEYENLLSTLDNSGQNLARSYGLHPSNDLSRIVDLRLKLHLHKVRFLLFTKNLKLAKREIKMAMNMARGKDSSMALVLKSQLEYARGNYWKAIKLLMASSNQAEMGISSIFNNNLGCIYHRLGKYHTSSVFFSKALGNSSSLRREKPLKLSTFSQDKSLYIIYNCGVQHLACGKPILAARCFLKASSIFRNRPLLWLRIAECCLMAFEKGLLKPSLAACNKAEVKVHVIGKGRWRQLVLEDGVLRNGQKNLEEKDDLFSGDDKQLILSMSLARQSLLNALHLLNYPDSRYLKLGFPPTSTTEEESTEGSSNKNTNFKASSMTVGLGHINANGDAKEQKGGNNPNTTLQNSILDYEDIIKRENHMIRQAILADLAYVELELGNPLKALSTARSLLRLPECSRIYLFLGNVYAAESLCLLDRPQEAAEHLLIYLSSENSVGLPYTEEDYKQCHMEKSVDSEELSSGSAFNNSSLDESQGVVFLRPDEARGTLFVNLAVFFAIQGDVARAHYFVIQALSKIPSSPEAIVTAIYVDLVLGKTQEALSRLKQCSHIRFLPGSVNSNSCS